MECFVRDTQDRASLIVGNLRVHDVCRLGPWLEERRDKIRLFYLPSYSSDDAQPEFLPCCLLEVALYKMV